MDHETALRMNFPERYAAGELAAAERDAFEEHFADCGQCLNHLWMASVFAANTRAVLRDRAAWQTAPARPPRRWWVWLPVPAFAAVALVAVAAYQNLVVMPVLRSPRAVAQAVILDGEVRAALPRVRSGESLRFQMAVERGPGRRVFAQIENAAGRVVAGGSVAAPGRNQSLDVFFPIDLHAGRYTLVVRADEAGHPGKELARSSFEVFTEDPT
jgi:hypothetical protein